MSERYSGGVIFNAPGGWSEQFDGSSSYLTVASNAAFGFGTGDFTVEFFIYPTVTANTWSIYHGTVTNAFIINTTSGGKLVIRQYGVADLFTSAAALVVNSWNHVAVARSGTTISLWLNGSLANGVTGSNSTNFATTGVYIGRADTVTAIVNGYMSNLRVVKGTAVYSPSQTSITVPTGALLPITNTSLLTLAYSTLKDGSTNNFTISTVGSPVVSTANPFPTSGLPSPALGVAGNGIYTMSQYTALKTANLWPAYDPYYKNVALNLHGNAGTILPFNTDASTNNFQVTQIGSTSPNNYTPFITDGYWSNYFDGSGDYLTIGSSGGTAIGTSNFTIEFWVYMTNSSVAQIDYRPSSTNGSYISIGWIAGPAGTASTDFYVNSNSRITSSTGPTLNAWSHMAVSRVSGSTRVFIDGIQVGSTWADSTTYLASNGNIWWNAFLGARPGTGYVSNYRLVLSGLYSSNFTPPTAPLTAISGTQTLICQSNRFKDNSSNNYALTITGDTAVSPVQPFTAPTGTSAYGSAYFNGTTDYLETPYNAALDAGTGAFTYEAWLYPNTTTNKQYLGGSVTNAFFAFVGSGTVFVGRNNVAVDFTSSATIKINQWNHVVIVRNSSNNIAIFINGSSAYYSASNTNNYGLASNSLRIGVATTGSSYEYNGYISNVKIAKSALYDPTASTITVPTAPLSAGSAGLLTVQTNAPTQNNTFLDSSTNNFTITRNGNTTQGTYSPYGSNWSNYFDGSGDYLSTPSSSGFNFGTGDFTVEAWVNTNILTGEKGFIQTSATAGGLQTSYTDGVIAVVAAGAGSYTINVNIGGTNVTGTIAVTTGTWYHVAFTRASGVVRTFINGVLSGGPTTVTANLTGTYACIGGYYSTGYLWSGYISNLRVVKGTALYTSTFTPSTGLLTAVTNTSLLTCQSNRFIDNSTNNFTITRNGDVSVQRFSPFTTTYSTSVIGGSGYFDGSGDYLRAPIGYLQNMGTGNFTVEGWWNFGDFTVRTTYFQRLWSFGTGLANDVTLNVDTSGNLVFRINDSIIASQSSGAMKLNSWNHVALVRSSGTVTIYLNGTSVGSAANSANLSSQSINPFYIGSESDGAGGYFYGYCCDVRVTNTAVYTTTFTPPTAPLTAISGTGLLLNMINASISDNAMIIDLETVGNTQISTNTKKYGNASIYLDGSGDYLYAKSNDAFNFGTGDFTVEFWINASASGSYTQVIGTLVSGTEDGTWRIGNRFNSANQVYFARGTGAGFNEFQASVNVNDGAWHHVAVVRYSGTVTIYVDGTSISSSSITGTCTSSNPLYIGYNGRDNAYVTGYLDDVRITQGVARYTANFKPPTSQLQDQ